MKKEGERNRPTSKEIKIKAERFLKPHGYDENAIMHFEVWAEGNVTDPSELGAEQAKSEYYPGWQPEDFAELLTSIKEGRRPSEEKMAKSISSFAGEMLRNGWSEQDVLRAMELYKNKS